MNFTKKAGFTLIELLVVITIIGILATGGVAVYTGQIQKARDTTRISDIKNAQSAIEQYYGDQSVYPSNISSGTITKYMPRIPQDAKHAQSGATIGGATCKTPTLDYGYNVGSDSNGVADQRYQVSSAFENKGNLDAKALNSKDNGNDDCRLEVGIPDGSGSLSLANDLTKWSGQ